ncbi:hypothetical protein PRUPE_3G129500 [Prunus persica]|uniref:Uncharacterized protein n=1 Tax=Prunus persica TaxID=3760 RepID=A0A251PZB2_PRUPE|nr:hypothetical protein PRUPE_3G129500 [Prunus persica]
MDLRKIGLASNLWKNSVWFGGEKIYPASLSLLQSEESLSSFFFPQIYYLLGSFGKLDMKELRETVVSILSGNIEGAVWGKAYHLLIQPFF